MLTWKHIYPYLYGCPRKTFEIREDSQYLDKFIYPTITQSIKEYSSNPLSAPEFSSNIRSALKTRLYKADAVIVKNAPSSMIIWGVTIAQNFRKFVDEHTVALHENTPCIDPTGQLEFLWDFHLNNRSIDSTNVKNHDSIPVIATYNLLHTQLVNEIAHTQGLCYTYCTHKSSSTICLFNPITSEQTLVTTSYVNLKSLIQMIYKNKTFTRVGPWCSKCKMCTVKTTVPLI